MFCSSSIEAGSPQGSTRFLHHHGPCKQSHFFFSVQNLNLLTAPLTVKFSPSVSLIPSLPDALPLSLFMGYPSPVFLGLLSPSWSHSLRDFNYLLDHHCHHTEDGIQIFISTPDLSLELQLSTGHLHFDISQVLHPKLAPKRHSSSIAQNPLSHLPCCVERHQLSNSFNQTNPSSRNPLDTSFPSSN